jgi:hypothetical protein
MPARRDSSTLAGAALVGETLVASLFVGAAIGGLLCAELGAPDSPEDGVLGGVQNTQTQHKSAAPAHMERSIRIARS